MYPELKRAGGLSNALDLTFAKINSPLRVRVNEELNKLPFTIAIVENGNKFSQVYIAAKEKLYMPDFWRDGVCLAHAGTDNLLNLAKVIDCWLTQDLSTQELAEKYSFVQPNVKAKAFDENNEVEYAWALLLQKDDLKLNEFVQIASQDEVLNKLFPFTSLNTLCFSKCTGFPFDTTELPNVTPKEFVHFVLPKNSTEYGKVENNSERVNSEKIYVVTKNYNQYLGEGNAQEAFKIVRDNLPANIKPARKGTADG